MSGVIAAHYVASAGTASRVGSYSSGTSTTVTLPQAATAGNLLVICVEGNATSATVTCSASGWTSATSLENASGVNHTGSFIIYKVAAGGETSVTLTTTATALRTAASEWSGSAAWALDVVDTAPPTSTATSGTLTSPGITTAQQDLVLSMFGARVSGTTATWGGGDTQDLAITANTPCLSIGVQQGAAGSYAPSVTFGSSSSGPVHLLTAAFKIA